VCKFFFFLQKPRRHLNVLGTPERLHAEDAKILLGAIWRPRFMQPCFISFKFYQGSTFWEPLLTNWNQRVTFITKRLTTGAGLLSNVAEHHGNFPDHMTTDTSNKGLQFWHEQ